MSNFFVFTYNGQQTIVNVDSISYLSVSKQFSKLVLKDLHAKNSVNNISSVCETWFYLNDNQVDKLIKLLSVVSID